MPSTEYDLNYLQNGLVDLEGYLLSKELYWPVNAAPPAGGPPFPRLTLGNLLIAQARLRSRSLNSTDEVELARLETRMNATRDRWRTAWEQKAHREFQARLNLWRDYLEDFRQDPAASVDRYNYEVRRRVMLHLLSAEAGELKREEVDMLSGLDKLLQSVFIRGAFIWDDDLASGFPESTFWYLYGRPRSK